MKLHELITSSLTGQATLVIKNANVVNVFTDEIIKADVALCDDTIIGVGEGFTAPEVVDAEGAYLCPGFIDAHVHIESSMVIPDSFARVIMPHGTTTIIADPHEIANVAGVAGIRAIYKLTDDLPLRVMFMMPSCVPATPFENSGATLIAEDMEQFMRKSRMLGLGEVMDCGSAINCSKDMLDKLRLFDGRPIDGHAPLLSGRALNAYRIAGPSTDHECSNFDEVLEKLRTGMRILLRVGSAANDIDKVLTEIVRRGLPTDNMMFCTDDKHIENIREEGHINYIARLAVKCGVDPIQAVKMASYNAARAYGLKNIGAIAPGYKGDMVLFKDLKDFEVVQVFTRFGRPYEDKPTPMPIIPPAVFNSVHLPPLTLDSFALEAKEIMPVISLIDGQLVNNREDIPVLRDEHGMFVSGNGLNKLAVIERHHLTGNIGLGILKGFGIKGGAIASTVGHDSHNLIIAGDNDEDMLIAADALKDCGGGICVVSKGIVLARLPLPIAGLMTDAPVEDVLERQRALLDAAKYIGIEGASDPMVTLSFLALPVIPSIRLTDKGLFDSVNFCFIQ